MRGINSVTTWPCSFAAVSSSPWESLPEEERTGALRVVRGFLVEVLLEWAVKLGVGHIVPVVHRELVVGAEAILFFFYVSFWF